MNIVLLRLLYAGTVIFSAQPNFGHHICLFLFIQLITMSFSITNIINQSIVTSLVIINLLANPSPITFAMAQSVPAPTPGASNRPVQSPVDNQIFNPQGQAINPSMAMMNPSGQMAGGPMMAPMDAMMSPPMDGMMSSQFSPQMMMSNMNPYMSMMPPMAPMNTASVTAQASTTEPEVNINSIDPKQITEQLDKGELPSSAVMSAIITAPSKMGAKIPEEFKNLKEHLLDRVINHSKMLMKALESKEDDIIKAIAEKIHKDKEGKYSSVDEKDKKEIENHYASLPDGSSPISSRFPSHYGPHVPLTVGFDPFSEKPKPGFFGRVRRWFGYGGQEPNLGHHLDSHQGAHNSFGRHGAAWGRSTVYYPPLQYSSHLIPVSSGAFDLKRYDFRPYRPGHPRITRRRFVTRIILRRRDPPIRRNQIERDQIDEERNNLRDHVKLDQEIKTERDYYERMRETGDSSDPKLAVPDPRHEEQYGFKPSKLYKRPLPQLDYTSRLIGYPGDNVYKTNYYTGPGNQNTKTVEEEINQEEPGVEEKPPSKTSPTSNRSGHGISFNYPDFIKYAGTR